MNISFLTILFAVLSGSFAGICVFLNRRLKRQSAQLQEQILSHKHLNAILDANERILKEKLILRLCYNAWNAEKGLDDVISHYKLREVLEHAVVVLIRFTDITSLSSNLHRDTYYRAQQDLNRACHNTSDTYFPSFWLWENPSTMIGILTGSDALPENTRLAAFNELGHLLQEICCSDKWNSPVIAFGNNAPSWQELSHSYDEAAELLNHKIHTHTTTPYSYEEFRRTEIQFDYNKQSLLARYVMLGKTNDAVKLLGSWFSIVHANPDTSLDFIKETSLRIIDSIRDALEKKPGMYTAAGSILDEAAAEVSRFSTVHHSGEYLVEMIQKLCECSLNARTSKGKLKTDTLIQWMNENYSRDISLEDMAETIGCSISYTSKLFKKETGCDISTYLSGLRISHAKELLATTHMSLAEISAAVGFNNQQTLIRNFKSLTGLTPTEFRSSPDVSRS